MISLTADEVLHKFKLSAHKGHTDWTNPHLGRYAVGGKFYQKSVNTIYTFAGVVDQLSYNYSYSLNHKVVSIQFNIMHIVCPRLDSFPTFLFANDYPGAETVILELYVKDINAQTIY